MPRQDLIQLRHGFATDWTRANPVLGLGEPGHETDTGLLKVGDGFTAWNEAPYVAESLLSEALHASSSDQELLILDPAPTAAATNTASINSALASAHDAYVAGAGVRRLVMPAGRFWIRRTPGSIPYAITVPDGVELSGAGEGRTILSVEPFDLDNAWYHPGFTETGFYQAIFYIKGTASALRKDVYLHDFTVDGNRANMTGSGPNANAGDTFDLQYCTESVALERLTVINSTSDAFDVDESSGTRLRFCTAVNADGWGFHNSENNNGVVQIGNYAQGCGFAGHKRGGFDQYGTSVNGVYIGCIATGNYRNFEIRGSRATVLGGHSASGTHADLFEGCSLYNHPGENKGEVGLFGNKGQIRFADQGDPTNGSKRWLQYVTGAVMAWVRNNTVQLVITSDQNLGIAGQTSRGATASKAILLPNGTPPTGNPTGGGILVVDEGTLRYRTSGGRLATLVGNVATPAGDYQIVHSDEIILAYGGTAGRKVTLPTLRNGMKFTIKKIDAGPAPVTVDGNGARIDGFATKELAERYDHMTVVAAVGAWHVI